MLAINKHNKYDIMKYMKYVNFQRTPVIFFNIHILIYRVIFLVYFFQTPECCEPEIPTRFKIPDHTADVLLCSAGTRTRNKNLAAPLFHRLINTLYPSVDPNYGIVYYCI